MSKVNHLIFITLLVLIVVVAIFTLSYIGVSFYKVSIEERYFHPLYAILKPSGSIGHGLGILGSLLMIIGVFSYMLRKRYRIFSRLGLLKHWLEFHIFLCTLGPILVLFHTSFKFGGIVAISFWSMVAVFLSGIIGRFIYIQIPRSVDGTELSLNEVENLKINLETVIGNIKNIGVDNLKIIVEITKSKFKGNFIKSYFYSRKVLNEVKSLLNKNNIIGNDNKKILNIVKAEISLNRKIDRLVKMQNLLKYWHLAHLPFAFIMLIVMIIHVVITILFGYKWIF